MSDGSTDKTEGNLIPQEQTSMNPFDTISAEPDPARRATMMKAEGELERKLNPNPERDRQIALERARQELYAAKNKSQQILRNPGAAILASRDSRLTIDAQNQQVGPVKRFMRSKVGWIVRSGIQALPSPWLYGPGDVVTGISAASGKDILTGERLDPIDRALFGVATVIPGVPATILVGPMRAVRRGIENATHSYQQKDKRGLTNETHGAITAAKEVKNIIQETRKQK